MTKIIIDFILNKFTDNRQTYTEYIKTIDYSIYFNKLFYKKNQTIKIIDFNTIYNLKISIKIIEYIDIDSLKHEFKYKWKEILTTTYTKNKNIIKQNDSYYLL